MQANEFLGHHICTDCLLLYSCHTFLHSALDFTKLMFGECQFIYTEVSSSIIAILLPIHILP